MKTITFNRKNYASYKDFYADVYDKLNGKENWDFDYCKTPLGYSGDTLNEFLWYYHDDNIKYIFKGFDWDKIKETHSYDDYKYNIVLVVFERFVNQYPNNQLEIKRDEDDN